MDISSINSAAAAFQPKSISEISARQPQDDNKDNQSPAVAKSEDQATPPPKKKLGATLDVFA